MLITNCFTSGNVVVANQYNALLVGLVNYYTDIYYIRIYIIYTIPITILLLCIFIREAIISDYPDMASAITQDLPSVADFYKGRDVFLTGATGFIGKVFIEKMLRCCPDISTIFVLVRPRRNKSAQERLKSMFKEKVVCSINIWQSNLYLLSLSVAANMDPRQDHLLLDAYGVRMFYLLAQPCIKYHWYS